jgi:hypothetical protein
MPASGVSNTKATTFQAMLVRASWRQQLRNRDTAERSTIRERRIITSSLRSRHG